MGSHAQGASGHGSVRRCYGSGGPKKDCTLMLAKAIIGNAKKCYDLHKAPATALGARLLGQFEPL